MWSNLYTLIKITVCDELDESSLEAGDSAAFSALKMESMHCSLRTLSSSISYINRCKDLKRS